MDLKIGGKTAVVTGAGNGIGRAVAVRLADEGASVVVADIRGSDARRTADEISDRGGTALSVEADGTREADVDVMVAAALQSFESLDILVNNVGGGFGSSTVVKQPVDEWDRTIEINLKSTFLACHAAAPHMIGHKQGRIINISSISGKVGEALVGAYSASKFGVIGLTQVLAKELGRYSITVNAVCPGYVWTPGWEQLASWLKERYTSMAGRTIEEIFDKRAGPSTALGRPQTVEDVASLVAYLASEDARNITGQAINVDGGAVMC
ncbi:MAG TPA: SDR family oxidoreductase [Deltaproteobacteria bacterium]|nr:SDR family oxidoreductase [Deltaproteobacteria bacterium]